MIGKKMFYLAIVISSCFAIERNVIDISTWKDGGTDTAFISATEVSYSLDEKRGVFGRDDQGRFFSLYEKDPNHPKRTIIKTVRAKKDRKNKKLLEYLEYDTEAMLGEIEDEGLFLLTSEEIRKRLMQNGPTY